MQAPEPSIPKTDKLGHRTTPEPYHSLAAMSLRDARLMLNYSPDAIAIALGISRRQWLAYEAGEKFVPLSIRLALTMLLILHHAHGRELGQKLISELRDGTRTI